MRQTSSSPLVERLSWDSNFWGVSTARLNATTPSNSVGGLIECRELGVRWTSMLVPVERTALIDAAIRSGFSDG